MRHIRALCAGVFACLLAGSATAETPLGLADIPEAQREAYRRSLDEPFNLDLMFASARELEEAGAYDAALRLFRRMLILDESLPGIWLRVALLEYRQGDMAGALASLDALERAGPSADVARSAEVLREQVQKARSRHQVYGVVSSGWRFQTNVNAAPDDAPLFLGAEAPVLAASTPESDHSAFLDAALLYRFDPQRQDGQTIDTRLWFDGEKYLEVDEFDRVFARITTGPRFQIDPSRPDWTAWRPYLVGEILSFGGEVYSITPGAGIGISHKPRHDVVLSGEVEVAWRFHGSAAKVSFDPSSPGIILEGEATALPLRSPDDRDGLTLRTAFGAEWTPRPELLLAARPFLALRDARDDAVSAVDVGIQGSATLLVESVRLAAPLQLSLVAQYRHAFYRDPDRQVTDNPGFVTLPLFPDPFLERQDKGVSVNLLAELPILSVLLFYTHLLLGRLHELSRLNVYPPQTHFFTIRSTAAQVVADFCFFFYVPLISAWFFLRTIFRPESPLLLALLCATTLFCSLVLFLRSRATGSWLRRMIAIGYFALAGVLVVTAAGVYAAAGRAPFQNLVTRIVNLELEGADLSNLAKDVELAGFSFDGQCMRNVNLSGLDLTGASFAGADLIGAKLQGTRLLSVDFSGARLSGADMTGANLTRARLTGASVVRANAEGATFDDANLQEADLSVSNLAGASMLGVEAANASFRKADMTGARLSRASLHCADFREVVAERALFQNVSSAHARFARATLTGENFIRGNLDAADFTLADLRKAKFGGASLDGTVLDRALVDEAELNQAAVLKPTYKPAAISKCADRRRAAVERWQNACR